MDEAFTSEMTAGYGFDEPCVILGRPMKDGEIEPGATVQLPLSMMNRHGLVAGATGTGKTKTLQIMAGQLSDAGVPVFISDIKGDVTGLSRPGDATAEAIRERSEQLGIPYEPRAHPVELLSLSGALGAPVRATVSSFGPLLLGKVLDLNKTQVSVLTLVFTYCDDQRLPLARPHRSSYDPEVPLLRRGRPGAGGVRRLLESHDRGAAPFARGAGGVGRRRVLRRARVRVTDLLRTTDDGRGVISLLEIADVMDRPRLFSTFMLWMLAQLYATLPEVGDLPKPKLAFFFDEAHLLFHDASEALMEQIELTARLIRSKGVGVYFVTQSPTDVPSSVLSQLGNRVQHALRAFTPDDAENLRKTVKTFPMTDHYDVGETLTSLGIGEALVTVLTPKGVPTPLAATRLIPPDSFMDAIDEASRTELIAAGELRERYATPIDRESAHEILTGKLHGAAETATSEAPPLPPPPPAPDPATLPERRTGGNAKTTARPKSRPKASKKSEKSMGDQAKDIGIGLAKDLFTTADGRRTLRTVFGTLLGRK